MRIAPVCSLKWVPGGSHINPATKFIRDGYFQQFGAHLTELMPWVLMLCDGEENLLAACGMKAASHGALFLEQYLDKPAESSLQQHGFCNAQRGDIVEVGNFAATEGSAARVMYVAVCLLLNHYRYRYIMFTGTVKIRNIFSRLHLKPVTITAAEPTRLTVNPAAWGDYYQHAPQVMAGDLTSGQKSLAEHSLLLNLFDELPVAPWRLQQKEIRHVN